MPVTEPRNSHGLPLFSQTLEAQRLRQLPPPQDKFFIPQIILFSLPALAIGVLLIAARPNIAQTGKSAKNTKPAIEKPLVLAQADTKSADIALEPETDDSGRRPLEFYTGGVRGNMFSPPQPPKPFVKKPVVVKVTPPKKVELPQVPVVEINPFQDWAYTGVITMGESRMALLENTKTKEGQYVKPGETFLGSQVSTITDQGITFATGKKSQMIAKSDTINVTPLSANAPFLQGGGGGQPQPGQPMPAGMPPGMPQGMPTQMNIPGAVVLPNGRSMSPEQAARRTEWMNGNFRGGGRGGRNR